MPALLTYLFLHGLNNWLVGRATEKIENEIAWNEDGVPFVNESSIARVNNGDSLLTINPKDVGLEDSDSVPDELKNNQRLEDGLTNTLNSVYVSLLLYNQFHSEAEGSSPKLNDYHETISSFDEFDRFVKSELNVPIMRITKDHAQREAWFHYLNKSFFAEESKRKNWRLVEFVDDPDESKAEWKVINAHLSNVHAHWAKSLPIRVIRWTNGWIQCVTAYLFWLALTVLAVRLISLRIHAEIVSSRGHFLTGKGVDGLQSERPRIRMSWVLRHPKRGSRLLPVADDEMPFSSEDLRNEVKDLESPVNWKVRTSSPVLILRNLYRTHLGELHDDEDDQQDLGLATSALQHFTQNQKDQQESGLAEVMYLAWAIPSVGFIGTVLGIGDGLLGAGAMITPNMEQQKIAIESVTLALGAAFDTTLVALVLSIPLMLTLYLVRRWQADRLLKFQERVMENVLPYFPGLRKDAVGGVVAAVLPTGGRKSKTVKKRAVGRKRTAKS